MIERAEGDFLAHGGELKNLMLKNKDKEKIFTQLFKFPRLNLNTRQLCDLELLLNGGFSPLEGFMDKEDYESVVRSLRLKNGVLWPVPIVLDVPDIKNFSENSQIILCDEYGKPLALFTVTSIYEPDKMLEAKKVYGTSDTSHFGVNELFNYVEKYYLGGRIQGIDVVDHYDFTEYRYTPRELRKIFLKKKWTKIIGFQTRNPLHKAHHAMIKKAGEEYGANILLHPSVGQTKDGDIDYVTRTKCYIEFYKNHANNISFLSLLPLAMRMAGPKEALWHAIIRKNFGCTHFIVGRDHAGPGKNSKGLPFYKPYEAQKLVKQHAAEIGIEPIFFKEMVYVEEKKTYMQENQIQGNYTIKNISGTEFRRMIINNETIPEWFSFPEVITEIKRGVKRQKKDGLTLFFTGLASAGKSTIAQHLYFRLLEIQDKNISFLDGDIIRQNLSKGLGFSKEDRDINIARIGFVANEITKHGGIAICAAVAPYQSARQKNRALISKSGNYVEIYVATPLEICIQRDVKGYYEMAAKGKMQKMTGVDDPYEVPINPELTIKTKNKVPLECVNEIVSYLVKHKLICS